MFSPPYRWFYSPGTFFGNLWSCWRDLTRGVYNILHWTPVIWRDRDWDWSYLASIMEYKLRRMGVGMGDHGIHKDADKDAAQMLECADILKRLLADEYYEKITGPLVYKLQDIPRENGYTELHIDAIKSDGTKQTREELISAHAEADRQSNEDQKRLGVIIGENLRNWWD